MDVRIAHVIDHINEHLAEPMNNRELAQIACLSEAQFYPLFKREAGMPPGQLIAHLRLSKAHEQLLLGSVNIQQLSEQCGYRNYETFSRAFKAKFALAPDDLAKIVDHIKELQSDPDGVFVLAVDADDQPHMESMLKTIIEQHCISDEQLKDAVFFKVQDQPADRHNHQVRIKNKFTVSAATDLSGLLEHT